MVQDLTQQKLWDDRWAGFRGESRWKLSVRELDRHLRRVLDRVPENGSLLELGGAPGRIAERHFRLRPDLKIDCLDFSPVGTQRTRELYESCGIKGDVIESDFRAYSAASGDYDLVCSYGLVEHFDEIQDVVSRHFDFAKPGGMVSIVVPNYAAFPVRTLLNRFSHETVDTHNLSCMDPEVLTDAVRSAGGVNIEAGSTGAAILPHSSVNKGFGGRMYGRVAQAWNLLNSMLGLATGDRLVVRLWRHSIYVVANKKVD